MGKIWGVQPSLYAVMAKPPYKRSKHKQYKQGAYRVWLKQRPGVDRGGARVAGPIGCKWARLGK